MNIETVKGLLNSPFCIVGLNDNTGGEVNETQLFDLLTTNGAKVVLPMAGVWNGVREKSVLALFPVWYSKEQLCSLAKKVCQNFKQDAVLIGGKPYAAKVTEAKDSAKNFSELMGCCFSIANAYLIDADGAQTDI